MPTNKALKSHIENMVCPIYDIHPIVEEDCEGIKIICCCKEFEKQCLTEAVKLLGADNKILRANISANI